MISPSAGKDNVLIESSLRREAKYLCGNGGEGGIY